MTLVLIINRNLFINILSNLINLQSSCGFANGNNLAKHKEQPKIETIIAEIQIITGLNNLNGTRITALAIDFFLHPSHYPFIFFTIRVKNCFVIFDQMQSTRLTYVTHKMQLL